ncbi:MAG TPA: hypothetical protein EYP14_12970, partial [Planctomycetaceae bacterium]|nr:hypothetical protein [Planctomycetaceae bacterium]
AGPAFLSDEWLQALQHALRIAAELDMDVQLSVASSWDMGGAWVEPEHASMGLYHVEWEVTGPADLDQLAPFPAVPAKAPKTDDGRPLFFKDVALLAIPVKKRRPAHEFIFELEGHEPHRLDRVVLYNASGRDGTEDGAPRFFAKEFSVAVSLTDARESSFREVLRGTLRPAPGAQRFDLRPRPAARFVRLRIHSGHNSRTDRVALAEFEAWSTDGINVVASHQAVRTRDGAVLTAHASSRGADRLWSAANIHDGAKRGAHGVWMSSGPPPLVVDDPASVIDLTNRLDRQGHLHWRVPPGRWALLRFVCMNTGERLKIPSPASDGLATDHLSAGATRHFLEHLLGRLRSRLGWRDQSALTHLYLASYEVRGPIWTPDFLDQFRRYRGYDMIRYLVALVGGQVGGEEQTQRFLYDYRKTLAAYQSPLAGRIRFGLLACGVDPFGWPGGVVSSTHGE